ncbi:LytTR family DNA-binding domain-containing protein (plasmid) [Spirosoma sp. SC4-14]|uniref:LytR/AlgR family response regulator transcription factor n=1 Tax=Spirosoma sp. SC4-14 TaxID=3128900 RepID=UPI0030D2233D
MNPSSSPSSHLSKSPMDVSTGDLLVVQNLKRQLSETLQILGQLPANGSFIDDDYFYVQTARRLQKVYFHDIIWIESERNYVTIFTIAEVLTVHRPISKVEEQLPKNLFSRVHKSFIVANQRVDFVEKDQIGLRRAEGTIRIPLGPQFKKTFIKSLDHNTLK